MHKYSKYIFPLFLILTIIETIIYIFSKSNYYGLFYLIINYIITFFLLNLNFKSDKKIYLSKVIVVVVLGIFSSFLLINILENTYTYNDDSSTYIDKIMIISKIIKPLIYMIISIMAYTKLKINHQ